MRGQRGHIRKRGKASWEVKFSTGVGADRKTFYVSVKGSKADAQARLTQELARVGDGSFAAPSKITVGAYALKRIEAWAAGGEITQRSARRYHQLLQYQIEPHLGGTLLQKLGVVALRDWHGRLREQGLAFRTVRASHRLLHKVLAEAERDGLIQKNVARLQRAPRRSVGEIDEIMIVRDAGALLKKLCGEPLWHPLAVLGLYSGARLGELLALRWGRVHLVEQNPRIEIVEALDGTSFKKPKTRAGERTISLPAIVVETLRAHRVGQMELRLRIGAGRLTDDDLVFSRLDGRPHYMTNVSSGWRRIMDRIGMGEITFHALRHTHASQLIDAGLPITTIAKRLGHANPGITLPIYSHCIHDDDRAAAAAIDAALRG
jgi:integrase